MKALKRSLQAILSTVGLSFMITGAALAYTPPPYGPGDLNTTVTRNAGGERVVRVSFEPEDGTTYQVYRHGYGDGRSFRPLGAPLVFNSASPPAQGSNGWNYDSVYGYVYYEDGAVTDYAEYYYLVRSSSDPSWDTPPLKDYIVARAFPPSQTRHGEFSEYTSACTGCHGLHSSNSRLPGLGKLLRAPTQTDLCGTCHDGSGSKYDEVLGRVRTGPTWSEFTKNPAGPFGTQLKDVAGAPKLTAVHNVWRYGMRADASAAAMAAQYWQAPGSTYLSKPDPDPGTWTKPLTCVGCHEPHNKHKNFRLLRGDFDLQDYNFPDNAGNRRMDVVVRGVSEVNLDGTPPANDWNNYTKGQSAVKFLGGSDQTGGAITDFCSGCHRAFTGPYNELDPEDTGHDDISRDNAGTHGWKRHRMGVPAVNALNSARIVDPGLTGDGSDGVQSWLADWNGSNFADYVPLEGTIEDDPNTGDKNEYAQNRIVCYTCHIAHGTAAAAGGFAPPGDTIAVDGKLQLEVAYWNKRVNSTEALTSDDADSFVYDRAYGRQLGRVSFNYEGPTVSGYLNNRLTGPNGESGVIYGFSAALSRFQPFASACWRCHSTR